jgi:hypothetical protein
MNNQSPPSFTRHSSAGPTAGTVTGARARSPGPTVGSRKCGGVSRSDVGRKTTTTTPANLPPGGVSCWGVGMVASFQAETAAVWSI